jgi:hypothetical protein
LDVIVKRRTDRIYDEGGWGKQLNFTAARRTGKPLFVQLRVMKTMELQVRDGVEPPTVFDGELVADGEALVSFRLELEVTKLSDKAIQVMRVNNEPRLEMIYALHSQFGALTFIFNTANEGMLGPEARDMYRKTVETTWIGTKKRLY